jgi:hypothetical protein
MSDLTIGVTVNAYADSGPTSLTEVRANNPKGAAFLRMFVDVEDAPSADDYGRAFVQLTPDDLADLKSRAELAGLSVSEDRA